MKKYQKRNRAGIAKERWIMGATSVFVLTALTLTGIYVRDINKKSNDGYVVDFSAMENNGNTMENNGNAVEGNSNSIENSATAKVDKIQEAQLQNQSAGEVSDTVLPSDDLDFDPYFQEANSNQLPKNESADSRPKSIKEPIGSAEISVSGLPKEVASNNQEVGEVIMAAEPPVNLEEPTPNPTDKPTESAAKTADQSAESTSKTAESEKKKTEKSAEPAKKEKIPAISTSMQSALTFKDGDNLVWPIVGNVLINYSMDKTIYFPTLEQYKYNPAIIIQATEGEIISAAAAGKVTKVFKDPQIGNAVTMELGDGYELTYGQLDNILVSEGSYVSAGDIIAEVGAPTKYYSVEGTNVYFMLTKNGTPVNPMAKLN